MSITDGSHIWKPDRTRSILAGALAILAAAPAEAHYWCRLQVDIAYADGAPCPESTFEIYYLPDSLYVFSPQCGKLQRDFNGHCDANNTVTYFARGYYRQSSPLQENCTRTSLGSHPPPEPIAQAVCRITLEPGPVAEAGMDHKATLFVRDTLDASTSQPFPGRPILRWNWRQRLRLEDKPNPGEVVFRDSNTARPSYIPIVKGDYRFFVSVEDEKGHSDWDTVRVRVCDPGEECPPLSLRPGVAAGNRGIALLRREAGRLVYRVPAEAVQVEVLDPRGRRLAELAPENALAVWKAGRPGSHWLRVWMRDGSVARSGVFP